jgi:hypothetical protein
LKDWKGQDAMDFQRSYQGHVSTLSCWSLHNQWLLNLHDVLDNTGWIICNLLMTPQVARHGQQAVGCFLKHVCKLSINHDLRIKTIQVDGTTFAGGGYCFLVLFCFVTILFLFPCVCPYFNRSLW